VKPFFRLIFDKPRSAALNMAIDEMLMRSQERKDALPVLRIYFWDKPSITAGYFQDIPKIIRRFDCVRKGIPVVRRLTGGGLVFHGSDLTFSLSLKNPNPFLPKETKLSYQKINEALYMGLKKDFPDMKFVPSSVMPSGRGAEETVCFEKPTCFDLVVDGKKVVGAAQRRTQKTVLHQSAVFLEPADRSLAENIVRGFRLAWGIGFKNRPLTAAELKAAARLLR